MRFSVIIPTFNGGILWHLCCQSILDQSCQPESVIIIDSSSSDETFSIAANSGFECHSVSKSEFNHGGTRNYGLTFVKPGVDLVFFMTQDVILHDKDAFLNIIEFFGKHNKISAICGRQIPHIDGNPLASHARLFNYPQQSYVKDISDVPLMGVKVAFLSNSFAAYKVSVFDEVGKFPSNTILAEDMYVAAKMILAGYKVAYCAESIVRHSHNYTPWEEFRRYFDIGVFHTSEPWIRKQFGGAGGEGMRFIRSELTYLWQNAPSWIPRALLASGCKLLGYKLGQHYQYLPWAWRHKLSMYKAYWLQNRD